MIFSKKNINYENFYENKDWIFEWNLSFFKNKENDINLSILYLYSLILKYDSRKFYEEYVEILKFRVKILEEVKKELGL